MRYLFIILFVSIFFPTLGYSNSISNGFFVVEKNLEFNKNVKNGECSGVVPYPELSNSDEELFISINKKIHTFAKEYAVCNKGDRKKFSVSFDIPNSGGKDFISVRWITKKNNKIWRIDVLNFNVETANILQPDDIFNLLADNMIGELGKLSEGRLDDNISWEEFLNKIESRDVQLYLKDLNWYIVFNKNNKHDNAIDVKIPEYFLIGNRDHDRG